MRGMRDNVTNRRAVLLPVVPRHDPQEVFCGLDSRLFAVCRWPDIVRPRLGELEGESVVQLPEGSERLGTRWRSGFWQGWELVRRHV